MNFIYKTHIFTFKNFQPLTIKVTRHFLSTTPTKNNRRHPCDAVTFLDIGSRSIFNEDHDALRSSARKFFREQLVPQFLKFEKEGITSREIWEKAGENGFLGITIPSEHGGVGASILEAAVVIEEQNYTGCLSPAFPLHSDIIIPFVSKYGNPEQIKKYVPGMVQGKIISAIAMTEPGAGSDLQMMRTYAEKKGNDYVINGSKIFITHGIMADVIVLVAVTNKEAKTAAHGMSLFLVESGTKGFNKGRSLNKIGYKSQDTAELFFENCVVPETALLGEKDKAFFYLMNELQTERIVMAIIACAHAEFMFEETRRYIIERKAFRKRVADLQVIQHGMAELKTEICFGRSFVDNCLLLMSKGQLDNATVSMAKYWLTDLQNRVAYRCLQYHGGHGYMMENAIARAYRDARIQPIYGGTNEIMKELIGRTIFQKNKKGR